MRCIVWLLAVLAGAGLAAAAAPCALSEQYFARHNISADDGDTPGPTCGGQCCGRGREEALRSSLRRRVGARAAAATRPIAQLLLNTRRTLQEHLVALSHQSQNKTAVLFAQVYREHAAQAQAPLSSLYEDIRSLLRLSERDAASGEDLSSPPPRDLEESSRKFFRDVFPVAYHNVLKLDQKQFTPQYEACLRDAYDAVQPFGDVPQQLGVSLTRTLEAARGLLQVLALGAATLASSEEILVNVGDDVCSTALLKSMGCSRCRGHDTRPCRNYCLNVSRGCIGSLISELDGPWSSYVEGVERLARVDADATLRALDTRVSEAIMHALESHVILEKKVRQECGPASTVDVLGPLSQHTIAARRDALRAPPPDTELLQFAASLAASKKLFAGIADRLCDEADFAHDGNDHCWNGESIGEYTKPLVSSSSVSDQRYNSEVTGGAPQDPRVAALGDRLRQARQLLVSHTWLGSGAPAAEAFMQGDEAGEEGSGSGRSYDDDAAYDAEGSGEGSGSHRIDTDGKIVTDTRDTPSVKQSSAFTSRPASLLLLAALMAAARMT